MRAACIVPQPSHGFLSSFRSLRFHDGPESVNITETVLLIGTCLAEHLLTKCLSNIGSLLIILTVQRLHDVAWSQAGNGTTITEMAGEL